MEAELQGPGVLLRTIRKGDETHFPQKGDLCSIHYDLFLEDGTKIDSTRCPGPFEEKGRPWQFAWGSGLLLPGLEAALAHMSVGQVAEITIPSWYAYGARGCPPTIPPLATLRYQVELLQIASRKN